MCGIAGLQVVDDAKIPQGALTILQRRIFHRGPDAQSQFVTGTTGLVVTRLAIVDLVHGDQRRLSPDGSALIANGEIYISPELREQFPEYPFQTDSDCEAILPLYDAHG